MQATYRSGAPLNPALRLAALHGVTSSVRLHIERKDQLDGRDQNGQTALMIAASKNHVEVCGLLLQAGADPDLQDKDGLTALDLAIKAGATAARETLLEFTRNRTQPTSGTMGAWYPDAHTEVKTQGSIQKTDLPAQESSVEDEIAFGDWEPLTESIPPEDDAQLRSRAIQTQAAIDQHVPRDSNVSSWEDVSAYLPEHALKEVFSDSIEYALRAILLRSLREGSVPSLQIESLLEEMGSASSDNLKRLMSQVINDLGAELDERNEGLEEAEGPRVPHPSNATDEEQRISDDAVEYLLGLLQPGNDPGKLFAKEAYRLPLLTPSEEVEIAKEMELAQEQARDVLSKWDDGLCQLLLKCSEVESGLLPLKLVRGERKTGTDENYDDVSEAGVWNTISLSGHSGSKILKKEEGTDTAESDPVDELTEFLSHVEHLRELTKSTSAPQSGDKVRAVLDAMRLSGTFLCSLEQRKSKQPEAIEFSRYISRFIKARDRLILSNLKLVIPIVKRFLGKGAEYSDLLQEGHIGLIRAADKFDWRRGYRFSTMATWWIRQQVSRAAPELARLIRLPTHAVEATWEMARLVREYIDQYDYPPSVHWLAQRLGLSESKTESYLRTISEPLSLDVLKSNAWSPAHDDFDQVENLYRKECASKVEELLQLIGSQSGKVIREKVLRMRYGIGTREEFTLDEIGKRYNLTRERIRQIEQKAITQLQMRLRQTNSAVTQSSNATSMPSCMKQKGGASRDSSSRTQPPTLASTAGPMSDTHSEQFVADCSPSTDSHHLFTKRQQVLQKVMVNGIAVMHYVESGRQKTCVLLPETNSTSEKEIAGELLAAGFNFRPGQGFFL